MTFFVWFFQQNRDQEVGEENRGARQLYAREQERPTQQGSKLSWKKSSSLADTSLERAE